jgi:hypothetical protein
MMVEDGRILTAIREFNFGKVFVKIFAGGSIFVRVSLPRIGCNGSDEERPV